MKKNNNRVTAKIPALLGIFLSLALVCTAAFVPGHFGDIQNTYPTDAYTTEAAYQEDIGMFLIDHDGSEKAYKTYSMETMEYIADVLNTYRDLLGEDGTVHLLSAPISNLAHYLTLEGRYDSWHSNVYEVLQPMVDEGVYIYDAEETLLETMYQEYDYLSCDHHWNALGASRFADAMMRNQSLPVAGYYDYLYRLRSGYTSDNNYNREQLMEKNPPINDVQIPVPVTPVESYLLRGLTNKSDYPYLLDVNQSHFDYYALYITGMRGGWRTFETGYHTGRNALVFGDSFNTAFIPYITPYYDNITVADVRGSYYHPTENSASIKEYMEEYGADDVYIITCIWTGLDSDFFQNMLKYLEE